MSAFVVDQAHIDALVNAGLWGHQGSSCLRWLAPAPMNEHTYAGGEAWGPEYLTDLDSRRRELRIDNAGAVGQMLWAENVRSVNHRYAEDDWEAIYEHSTARWLAFRLTPVEILVAIDGYEYQSCEHPGWGDSEARAYCESLRRHAISRLPGYSDASTWHISTSA